jgi:acetyl esterase/lipase
LYVNIYFEKYNNGFVMTTVISIIRILTALAASISALLSIFIFIRFQWPAPVPWIIKLYASALSPVFVLIGVLCAITGLLTRSVYLSSTGIYVFIIFSLHIYMVTRPPDASAGFEKVFGMDWNKGLATQQTKYFLAGRTNFKLPAVPKPRFDQDITFCIIPDSDRKLLCDIWQPPDTIAPSGLALIYMHGAAWYMLDKDLGTRSMFSHLAAQGHVIMDVANRLSPETDMMGMVHDVKRAIVWMKENATTYGVNPDRIVVSGASSVAHLALMAAFTADNPEFTPRELEGKDASVNSVVSWYGPSELEAMYFHTNQHLTTRDIPGKPKKPAPTKMPAWVERMMGNDFHRLGFDKEFVNAGSFAPLLGGHPDECPEKYTLYSPVTHVHPNVPPVLLIHGEHDIMAPVKSTRSLYTRLLENKVQVMMHIIPQTEHAFDLFLPELSPSAHNALYDVERFLGLMASHPSFKVVELSEIAN